MWVEKRRPGREVLAAWCLHTEEQTHVPGSDPRVPGPGPRDLLVVTQTSGNYTWTDGDPLELGTRL